MQNAKRKTQNNDKEFRVHVIREQRFLFSTFHFLFSKLNRGISLIEAIIYTAIILFLMVVVVNTSFVVLSSANKTHLKRIILGEAGIAVERMVREIRLADAVNVSQSVLGVNPGVLQLSTIVSSEDTTPTTREFYLSGNMLMMKEGAGTALPLTRDASVTNLVFYHIVAQSTTSQAVSFELTAEKSFKDRVESHTFNATAVLRRSY